ncbi:MAG: hypothetical protein ACRD5G_04285, partial [Candidatus Acidiferrales bacterium]
VGADWSLLSAMFLPAPRAHFGMVVAHPGNSLVAQDARFIYVLGGQENSTDAPGGSAKVFRAAVNSVSGVVDQWTELGTPLPEPLVGPAATIFNGHIYVVGGLRPNGTPSNAVYTAAVQPDGTLSAWATSTNPYPTSIAFATAFGFAGRLYVTDGDTQNSTDPNAQSAAGVKDVRFAPARNGVVATWTAGASTIKQRRQHITWSAFGQVINAGGIYEGSPGSLELERSVVNSDGTLQSWNGITSTVNQIGANVYNAAAVVSPLQSPTAKPRFLLLGGQTFAAAPPGILTAAVYYNSAP